MQAFSDSEKEDFITLEDGIYTHKQIERKGSIVFMRMKKRLLGNER